MLVAPLLGAATLSAAPKSWELREDGRWQEVSAPTSQPIQDPVLDGVENDLLNRDYKEAHTRVVDWLKSHKTSPIRDRGLYLLGESNLLGDDRVMAFYNFDELLDYYPASPYFYRALERQYQIADGYLNGYKNSFLGLRILGLTDEAIEMLYRIQQRSPGSTLAEKSLRRTADYYYADGDYDLASDAYGAYARSYPRSPDIRASSCARPLRRWHNFAACALMPPRSSMPASNWSIWRRPIPIWRRKRTWPPYSTASTFRWATRCWTRPPFIAARANPGPRPIATATSSEISPPPPPPSRPRTR